MDYKKIFAFGYGERMRSEGRYILPITIHGHEATIELDMIDTNLPLLLAREEMEILRIILHLDRDVIELRGKRGPFTITEDEEAQATEAKGETEIAGNATGIGWKRLWKAEPVKEALRRIQHQKNRETTTRARSEA